MLAKELRLRKKEDFDRVFRGGKPLFFEEIGCRYVINGLDKARIGYSFGKKHVPNAVDRNRLRRRIAAAAKELQEERPAGVDIVFFTAKKPKDVTYAQVYSIVKEAFRRINKH